GPAAVPPDRKGGAAGPVNNPPNRSKQPLLVVPAAPGGSCHEDDLAAVGVDVGREERHREPLAGALHVGDQILESVRERRGSLAREEVVRARELQEGNANRTVLRLTLLD